MTTCIEAEDVILIHGRMIQNSGGMEGLQNCAQAIRNMVWDGTPERGKSRTVNSPGLCGIAM